MDFGQDAEKYTLEGVCKKSTRDNLLDLKRNWLGKFTATIEDVNGVIYSGDVVLEDVKLNVDRRVLGMYTYVITLIRAVEVF